MNNKQGWILLLWSLISAFIGMMFFMTFGNTLNSSAGDYYGIIGAIIGFMIPPIVYFGNRIDK